MFMVPRALAGGGAPARCWNDASRLPPSAVRGARGRPALTPPTARTAPWPGLPMARRGPGQGAREQRGRAQGNLGSFKFLPSFARRKWLWVCVTSARWREAEGAGLRLASGPAPCTPRRGYEVMSRGTRYVSPCPCPSSPAVTLWMNRNRRLGLHCHCWVTHLPQNANPGGPRARD